MERKLKNCNLDPRFKGKGRGREGGGGEEGRGGGAGGKGRGGKRGGEEGEPPSNSSKPGSATAPAAATKLVQGGLMANVASKLAKLHRWQLHLKTPGQSSWQSKKGAAKSRSMVKYTGNTRYLPKNHLATQH